MSTYSRSHLPDDTLKRNLIARVASQRRGRAALLADIAEFDARKLYLPEAYPSMYAYCVGELGLSEDVACNYIRAARAAREFPAVFEAVAEGRLHLRAVVLLAPHLTAENADALLAEASGKSKVEIERMLARWVTGPEPTMPVESIAMPQELGQNLSVPGRIDVVLPRLEMTASDAKPRGLPIMLDEETRKLLLYGRSLLADPPAAGDLAALLHLAVQAWVDGLEQKKFAKTSRPRPGQRRVSEDPRHISAEVRRRVWERDGGRRTFVSNSGHRCEADTRLEYDHVVPVARGGQATTENIRIRCRAHNQYAAEQVFGRDFMQYQREEAKRRAEQAKERDVTPWLRQLGFRADEARRAAEHCERIPDAPLEDRLKTALRFLAPRRGVSTFPAPV